MITQYKLKLSSRDNSLIPSSFAYNLYSWLLSQNSSEASQFLHNHDTPYISQHLYNNTWTVNLLNDDVSDVLSYCFNSIKKIELNNCCLMVEGIECCENISADSFLNPEFKLDSKRAELKFISKTAFKQSGRYVIFPNETLLIQSLISKWNSLFPEFYLSDEDMIFELNNGIRITDYKLRTGRYPLKNIKIPCFYGNVILENKLPIVLQELWGALLLFSQYSGIGIKTTLGMGAVEL